ncbi:MAG TPA: YpdA family putative bacillithiol disulfide reductase [bacterium]|jgi:thioredoxin reductase (NADPH)
MDAPLDLIIIGAGPAGIAVGRAARRAGLRFLILEKGAICNTIFHFPERMTFFSTADLLEFPDAPMVISGDKPNRHEVMSYFTKIALKEEMPVSTFEAVSSIRRVDDHFEVQTSKRCLAAGAVVLATGSYDCPNLLHVPGEDLPNVSHYYHSSQPYIGKRVMIIGGRNSAVETALDLYRQGAQVTVVHRGAFDYGASLDESGIKYWLLPDFLNRLKEEKIAHFWNSSVLRIEPERVLLRTSKGERWVDNDFVLALIGYHPDYALLERAGVEFGGAAQAPASDPATLETNVPGLYVAGVVTGGKDHRKVFIENSRRHGELIIAHVRQRLLAAHAQM